MKKIAIVYGSAENAVQKKAIEELSRMLLEYTLAYPVCFAYDEAPSSLEYRCIYIGTKKNNPYISEHSESCLYQKEEYALQVENDTVIIEGYDDAGVLYGVVDFYCKNIVPLEYPKARKHWKNPFSLDTLPSFRYTSAPAVRERGLWTWGHVIYDYRGYFDQMMRLKMNKVVIWNDHLPVHAAEIVAYAHACNIKIVWGFSWLWDTQCNQVSIDDLSGRSEEIFAKYEKEYANACGDGIYFQTFTELKAEHIGKVLIADAAAQFVNRTAALFYEKYPSLEIEFGLHATSVKDRLAFIATVDPRIRIVWEDCGAFPFSYHPSDVENAQETKAFVQKIACLRGENDRFGAVTKGLVELDWSSFEHLGGPQYWGVSSKRVKENRIERKKRMWRAVQAYWLANADVAYEMIQDMCRTKKGDLSLLALVEDGMFEEKIMYPVALYAEMLWSVELPLKTLMAEVALRNYIEFA